MINPGILRNVVKLLRINKNALTPNGFIDNDAWNDIRTIRCAVRTEASKAVRTVYRNDGVYNLGYKVVTCRYFEDILSSDRILINGLQYDIEFINNMNEENKMMDIWVRRAE